MKPRNIALLLTTLILVVGIGTHHLSSLHLVGQEAIQLPKIGEKVNEIVDQESLEINDDDDALKKVRKQLHNAALAETKLRYFEYRAGAADGGEFIFDASRRLVEAKLELAPDNESKEKVLKQFIEVNNEFETLVKNRITLGGGSPANLERLRYERFKYEAQLLRLNSSEK